MEKALLKLAEQARIDSNEKGCGFYAFENLCLRLLNDGETSILHVGSCLGAACVEDSLRAARMERFLKLLAMLGVAPDQLDFSDLWNAENQQENWLDQYQNQGQRSGCISFGELIGALRKHLGVAPE